MKPCNFGMDCEIHGSCYAGYHGRPELCGKDSETKILDVDTQAKPVSPFEETVSNNFRDLSTIQNISLIVGLIVEAAGGTITVSQRAMEKSPHDLTLVRTDNTDGTITFKSSHLSEQE